MDPNHVGKQIKRLRMKHGLKQREMAEQLSVASSTISNWENGNRLPSISELNRIAEHFDVSLGLFESRDTAPVEEDRMDIVSVGMRQSIEVHEKVTPFDPAKGILLVSGLTLLLLAATTTRLVSLFFLVSGWFVLGVLAATGLYTLVVRFGQVPKRVLLPLSYKIRLVHYLEAAAIERRKTGMTVGALCVLFFDLALYMMAFMLFLRAGETVLAMFAVLIGIGVLAIGIFRLKTIFTSQLYNRSIEYHRYNRTFATMAFELSVPLELSALALLVLTGSALDLLPRSGLYIGTVSVGVLTVLAAYLLTLFHRLFMHGLTLRVLDDAGKPIKII